MAVQERQVTVCSAFLDAVDRHADRPLLRAPAAAAEGYPNRAVEYTFAAALEAVQRLRGHYRAFDIRPGDRVALGYDSRVDVYLHLLALNAEAASIVPLNMAGTDAEVQHVIRHSECRLMGGSEEHFSRLRALSAGIKNVAVFNPPDPETEAVTDTPAGDMATEVALLYTSGTTGKPKGCILSNEYFLTIGRDYNALGGLCAIDCTDRLLTPLPPHHMNALACSFMAMLLCGGCVIQLDRFHPRTWWQTVHEEAATVIHYLGVMPAILLKLPNNSAEHFTGQVKFGFGAGCDPRHHAVFERRFGFPLVEAWAMTETGAGAQIVAHEEPRHVGQRCIGRPRAHIEYRLVDEQDRDVAPGQEGELLVHRRGDQPRQGFFSGYLRDEAATREGWRGGWWHTGDVVREGRDGSLFFVDRRKNVIRRSGENIAAIEVEAVLLQSDEVAHCGVTAVPDELRGDEVFAFIVPTEPVEDASAAARAIFAFSMGKLAYFKVPGYVAFVDALPVTASQKVNRAELKRHAIRVLETGAAVDLRTSKKRSP